VLVLVAQAENVGGKVGKFTLCKRDGRHWVLGQHNMRHDGSSCLALLIRYLMKTRDICVSMFLLSAPDKMAIRAELRGQFLPMRRIWRIRHRASEKAGAASNKMNKTGRAFIMIRFSLIEGKDSSAGSTAV